MAGASGGWLAFTLREPQKEKLALRWLTNAGFVALLPEVTRQQRRRHGNRSWQTVRRLALPGYVFVHVGHGATPGDVIATARDRVAALGRPVGMAGAPLLIADGWVEALLLPQQAGAENAWSPPPGATVALSGQWGGYKGLVVSVSGREVRVIVQALHRALSMTVPLADVRLAA
jgi:hypothetical protein